MKKLSGEIIHFFQNQGFVVVSTIDKDGSLHSACKGIVRINQNGKVYLLDLYQARTYDNLKQNPRINITAVDEHKFKGYCLKGKAKIVALPDLSADIIKAWEDRITSRITQRVIKAIQGQKGHPLHPEALLPRPAYMIVMEVEEIIDLTPGHLKQGD